MKGGAIMKNEKFLKIFLITSIVVLVSVSIFCQYCDMPLTISPSTLPQGSVGSYYFVQFTASGGYPPYYFYTETMPVPGLELTSDGKLMGTPQEAGQFSFVIGVYDSEDPPCTGSVFLSLTITNPCPVILIKPSSLPSGKIGEYYSQQLTAEGGVLPYSFSVGGGTLPPNIFLSQEGLISGTPTESGQYNFLVLAYDSANCLGSQSYSLSVECQSDYETLSGYLGISSNGGQSLYVLDGDSVIGTVTATSESGVVFTSNLEMGVFNFGTIPTGKYILSGEITYNDNILYDAKLLSYGCSAPSNSFVTKTMKLPNKSVEIKCDSNNRINYAINPPFVMIHGSFDCYNKWFSGSFYENESGIYFDNYARENGIISFTPNYDWWNGSYLSMANEVVDQIDKNFSGITKSGIPPFYVITHDFGGLLIRVLGSNVYKNNPIVRKLQKAFLLAPPNSGYDFNLKIGSKKLLGKNFTVKYFNDVFPDFGNIDVFPIAGNKGWWGTKNSDGVLSLDSVFNVKNLSCFEDDCVAYPSLKLPQSTSQTIPFSHNELGSPASLSDVFNLILSNLGNFSYPEAPVGAVGWGTTGVTSKKIGGGTTSFFAESQSDYPFNVSKCDGIAIVVNVISGSGTFKFVDANGLETLIENRILNKNTPTPGVCFLRVVPNSQGVIFEASVIENSIFGIDAYLVGQNFLPGENVTVRMDKKGDWSLVSSTQVSASLYDPNGGIVQTISLIEKGSYFSGSFVAPSTTGNYAIVLETTGLYDGSQFSRVEFESMNVISNSHLFNDNFNDFASDLNGNGKFDTISLTYSVNVPQEGYYVVSGDLYDSYGNFVSHASENFSVDSPQMVSSSLNFDLSKTYCEQFSGKFVILGLKLLDGNSLNTLDVWSNIETQNYSQSQFECNSTPMVPLPSYLTPSSITKGQTVDVAISGKNFKFNASPLFESPITVIETRWFSDRVIFAKILIPESASSGYYDVYVKNPDGKSGKLENGLLVTNDTPPIVSFGFPENGGKVGGVVNVTANVSDDIKVTSVSFEVDGTLQKIVQSYPFIWEWDTSKSGEGVHILKATATDSSQQTSSKEISVDVVQMPSVSTMSKKSNPFRIIVLGNNFQNGIEVYINNEKWNNVSYKNSTKIVVKGGSSLKSKVPKGERTTFKFVNPDGGETTYIYQR